MKKNSLLLFTLFLLVFAACAQPKLFGHRHKKSTANHKGNSHLSYLKMNRTGCFGRCPTYYVEIFENGLVRYYGIRFVSDTGLFEKKMDASKTKVFLSGYDQLKLDTLKESYDNLIVDLPGIFFTFIIDGNERDVKNASFGPMFLKRIARETDEFITNTDGNVIDASWKKVGNLKQ